MNIESRVVPGRSIAKTLSSPKIRLINVDLPTLGLPKTATAMPFNSCFCSSIISGSNGIVISIKSEIP